MTARTDRAAGAACLALAAALTWQVLPLGAPAAAADETVKTTDGRTLLLRSDGTYSEIGSLPPATFTAARATAAEQAHDAAVTLACLRDDPASTGLMRRAFDQDRQRTRQLLLAAGGTAAQWREIESVLQAPVDVAAKTDAKACTSILEQVYMFNGPGVPLFLREPFRSLKQP